MGAQSSGSRFEGSRKTKRKWARRNLAEPLNPRVFVHCFPSQKVEVEDHFGFLELSNLDPLEVHLAPKPKAHGSNRPKVQARGPVDPHKLSSLSHQVMWLRQVHCLAGGLAFAHYAARLMVCGAAPALRPHRSLSPQGPTPLAPPRAPGEVDCADDWWRTDSLQDSSRSLNLCMYVFNLRNPW